MTATRPLPRPGVLDIAPYVPGKSKAPGVDKIFKLSSNESPLGPSPKAIAAYQAAAARLEDYPDGAVTELRAAIGRAFGLDPERILCGAGSDDLLNLLAHAYLQDGDEAIYTAHGFLMYPIYILGHGAKPIAVAETNYTANVDAILAAVTKRTRIVFIANPNNPTGTYVPFDEIKRLQQKLPGNVILVLDAAYAEYVQRNDYEAGIELVATCENVVMCRTFSKIHGLAGVRLGWMYGPAAYRRCAQPRAQPVQRQYAGHESRHRRDRGHGACGNVDCAQQPLARLADDRDRQARAESDAERGEFRAHSFSRDQGPHRRRRRRFPDPARADPAPGLGLRPAQCVAPNHRHRGGQSSRCQSAGGIRGKNGVSKAAPLFNRLALIGVGLIGSSIARAARAQGAVGSIVATARSAATRRRVAELGLADQVVETNAAAVEGADLVIVCIPVGACGAVAEEIGPHLAADAIVSDVGSVKGAVLRDMSPHLPKNVHFVPAHPVAGTEYSGPDAGFSELFVNRWCILTPPDGADPKAVEKLATFWRLLGANVDQMPADHHDLVLAITSHLPHLIAYTIVDTADELQTVTRSEVLKFSAGGFRDFTRIAASDPTMWRDVFLANKDAVLEMLGRFNEDVATLTKAIRRGDGDALFDRFTRTRAIRKGIVDIGQDSPAPDFGRPHPGLPHAPLPKPYAADED